MTARLYHYRLMPGDSEHLPAYYFSDGVVEAEPDEIAAIVADVEDRHFDLLRVSLVEEIVQTPDQFRGSIGSAMGLYHQVQEDQACAEDIAYGVDPSDDLGVFEAEPEPD